MEAEKVFRTKSGYCHVLPDKIVLTRDGIRGSAAQAVAGSGMTRILLIYGGLTAMALYFAFDAYRAGQLPLVAFHGALAVFLLSGILRSLNNSATPVIPRAAIRQVRFVKGTTGLTRSRFEVWFKDTDGKVRKRLIMLPGVLADGSSETRRAVAVLQAEGLLPQH